MTTVIVDGKEYVSRDDLSVSEDFVILRCQKAGVHAGTLVRHDADFVELANSRRLWRWWSKFTLSGLATEGPLASKMSEQRYACVVPKLVIPTADVAEILYCTERAAKAIMEVPEWKN